MHSRESTAAFHESIWGLSVIIFVHSVSFTTAQAAGLLALCLVGIGWLAKHAESAVV
jgi:hypothetical protein